MASARETAERHANDVVAGNMAGVMGDLTPEALAEMQSKRIGPPRPTTKAEVTPIQTEGNQEVIDIKYSNDNESRTIRSWWEEENGTWKIVKADKAG